MQTLPDLAGRRFGKIFVLRRSNPERPHYRVKCDCGAAMNVSATRLLVPDDDPTALRGCAKCSPRHCVVCSAPLTLTSMLLTCHAAACREKIRKNKERNRKSALFHNEVRRGYKHMTFSFSKEEYERLVDGAKAAGVRVTRYTKDLIVKAGR